MHNVAVNFLDVGTAHCSRTVKHLYSVLLYCLFYLVEDWKWYVDMQMFQSCSNIHCNKLLIVECFRLHAEVCRVISIEHFLRRYIRQFVTVAVVKYYTVGHGEECTVVFLYLWKMLTNFIIILLLLCTTQLYRHSKVYNIVWQQTCGKVILYLNSTFFCRLLLNATMKELSKLVYIAKVIARIYVRTLYSL